MSTWIADHQRSALNGAAVVPGGRFSNATYTPVEVARDCSNMHWICRSAPRAALHAVVRESTMTKPGFIETTVAVEVQARVGGYLTPRWSFAIDRRSEDAGAIPSRRLGKAEHADLGI